MYADEEKAALRNPLLRRGMGMVTAGERRPRGGRPDGALTAASGAPGVDGGGTEAGGAPGATRRGGGQGAGGRGGRDGGRQGMCPGCQRVPAGVPDTGEVRACAGTPGTAPGCVCQSACARCAAVTVP